VRAKPPVRTTRNVATGIAPAAGESTIHFVAKHQPDAIGARHRLVANPIAPSWLPGAWKRSSARVALPALSASADEGAELRVRQEEQVAASHGHGAAV
jgi:hypothetical protein